MSHDLRWAGTGLGIAHAYWRDVVAPVLDEHCAQVVRSVARVARGSEVLGLDDSMSRDHDWGLRLEIFVAAEDRDRVRAVLDQQLPERYAGLPTRMGLTGQSAVTPAAQVLTLTGFVEDRLGFDPRGPVSVPDWLSVSGQAALEVTAGRVFEDQDGSLTEVRQALAWYPEDIWRYVIASGWHRLDQELPVMGRAGDRGDDLGSRVIAARLVGIAVHLAFVLCRRWAPYPKWRGILLTALPVPPEFIHCLRRVLAADDWWHRSQALHAALQHLSRVQREAALPVRDPPCVPFHDRPYLHIDQRLVPVLTHTITDPEVQALPLGLGAIDQRTDNVDVLMHASRRQAATRAAS